MRTSTVADPWPKVARTVGAYSVLSRVPNRLCRTEVATTTSAPSGSCALDLRTSRSDDGTPTLSRSAHTTVSQPMIELRLTWRATHSAAAERATTAPDTLASRCFAA